MEEYLGVNGKFVFHKNFPIIVDGACLLCSLSFVMYGTDLMSKETWKITFICEVFFFLRARGRKW